MTVSNGPGDINPRLCKRALKLVRRLSLQELAQFLVRGCGLYNRMLRDAGVNCTARFAVSPAFDNRRNQKHRTSKGKGENRL